MIGQGKAGHCRRGLLAVIAWLATLPCWGQEISLQPPSPGNGGKVPRDALATGPNEKPELATPFPGPGNVPGPQPLPPSPQEVTGSAEAVAAPPPAFLQPIKFDYTFLAGDETRGLEMNDFELSATMNLPFAEGWAPLTITPALAAHFWEGPDPGSSVKPPDLPSHLFDAYLDIGWRPRPARWLFLDFGVTPGLYSDFKEMTSESFQMRGRGLAIVAFSPQWQIVAGALYVNRNKTRVLPAGGVIWNPDDDTHLQLVFPAPKLAHRITTIGTTQWWGYLSGELGGGRWAVERADGSTDSLDYTDIRAILGLECVLSDRAKGHLETGYVFARRVNFRSDTPDFEPADTVMLRAGFSY